MSDLVEFSKLAMTLEPWRSRIVFVGGWAYRLYQYEPRAYKPDYAAVFTQDADVAYAEREPLEGDIKKALEGAGFKEEPNFAGGFRPPAMRYTLGEQANGFYAKFLTPLTGSGWRRNKSRTERELDATVANAGVVAQKLRHLEVLLHEPWLVTIPAADSGLGEAVADLRIPNPVSFMVQKLLIREDRIREKRAQDVLYIYDAMYIFNGAIEDDLIPIWKSLDGTLTVAQRKSVRAGVKALFTNVNDIIREAVRIPTDRRIEPDDMLKLCQNGFGELLGEAD
ncbi:nucleotidyltransferase domain-containing protein [Caballeronia sp. SEWSISQ10-4 2]|uniref:GSU2403 family nucleotidyltransferase fold protein n=1 Tax=Caballeronia sp. SEWSISQ10-4 2 TaxID=2937438 RepID=UPI002654BF5E|nr:GSU2403 family nucleotidyltransferase fold protein [Caballeronia sp. SEWSISQ10-4 2]MDN7178000.1 nucleotidyltransferase domain-containing protein [Caballeronia sp. SEWSISQ10-4 2]